MANEPKAPKVMVGLPVATYPTPVIEDSIEVETVDTAAGGYSLKPFGTPYNEVEHSAFVKDLPDHILVGDEAADTGGIVRKRTWAKVRAAQDRYNFAISYDGNDVEYPVYTRSYVLPREGYTPVELLSPDPFDPFALLIAEQEVPDLEPAQLKSIFVKVTRIYQTLPGPILYSIEYPYGGDPRYPRITTKQKFAHARFPDNLGTKCPIENYQQAVLVAQSVQQTEYSAVDQLQRIYDVVPLVTFAGDTLPDGSTASADDYGGQEKFGFSIGYMYGRSAFPFLTWNFTLPVEGFEPAPDLSFCPIEGFEKLRLVAQETKGDDKQSLLMVVSRRYETLPGPLVHKIDYDNNNPLFPIVSTSQRVATSEYSPSEVTGAYCPIPGYTNLFLYEQHMVPTDYAAVKEDQRIYELNPSDTVITMDYDSAVDAFVQTFKQKVPAGTIPVLDDFTLEFREKAIDKFRTIQIESRLTALPPTRVEYKTVNNWAFPTLLTGIALSKGALVTNRYEVVWFPNTLRPIQNVPAILRITTSYHTAPPPPEVIFVLPTRNLVYQGISFQFSITNVLCDKIDLSVTFTSDTKYGNLTESVSFAATNPSATQYYSVIGQYKVVGCDISLWRARIYVKTVTEVVLI
jgi:hypothetical protein